MIRSTNAATKLVFAGLLLGLAACADERPPMNPDNPGAAARPSQRDVYQQTFPAGGTPAQGVRAGTPPQR